MTRFLLMAIVFLLLATVPPPAQALEYATPVRCGGAICDESPCEMRSCDVQAGDVRAWTCMNNAQWPPPECKVELKGYGGWGVCVHNGVGVCPYVNVHGDVCLYAGGGDFACVPGVPPPVCVNHEQWPPSWCGVELKGYGGWGVCLHTGANACVYVDSQERVCLHRFGDLACSSPIL